MTLTEDKIDALSDKLEKSIKGYFDTLNTKIEESKKYAFYKYDNSEDKLYHTCVEMFGKYKEFEVEFKNKASKLGIYFDIPDEQNLTNYENRKKKELLLPSFEFDDLEKDIKNEVILEQDSCTTIKELQGKIFEYFKEKINDSIKIKL